jgi:hypothetical protein
MREHKVPACFVWYEWEFELIFKEITSYHKIRAKIFWAMKFFRNCLSDNRS